MKLRTLFVLCGGLTLLTAGSCKKEEPAPAPAEPQIRDVAGAVCALADRCCARGELSLLLGPFTNEDNCEDRVISRVTQAPDWEWNLTGVAKTAVLLPNLAGLEQAVREKRGHLDPKAVAECVAFLESLECNKYEDEVVGCVPPEPPPEDDACDPKKLFIGNLGEGQPCTSGAGSLECGPGLACRESASYGVYGRCVKVGQVGDTCWAKDECAEELYCSVYDGTCQLRRGVGETCAYSDRDSPAPQEETLIIECQPWLSCDPVSDTCVEDCQRGASCVADEQCDGEQELRCIGGRCDVSRVQGLPCSTTSDCVEGLRCAVDPQTAQLSEDERRLICMDKLETGLPCADTGHDSCASGFCSPETNLCAATVGVGEPCPLGLDQECGESRCVPEAVSCSLDTDCPQSGLCDTVFGTCSPYCVARKPDGAQCVEDAECVSRACVAEYCASLPLGLGERCDGDTECESEFCSLEDEPRCVELPLAIGKPCMTAEQCESDVCDLTDGMPGSCVFGLEEGEACGGSEQVPCNPHDFFCDFDEPRPVCAKLHEAGEDCDHGGQCRGECIISDFNRMVCDATPALERAFCDGE